MDSKEIKASLKEAREAIKNKNFALSLKLSKSILKADRENYMGFVFFGLSLQEIGPQEQAAHAFRKAININPDQPLAWYGMVHFYEKDDSTDTRQELFEAYIKLLDMESDSTKFSDLCSKFVNLAVNLQELRKSSEVLETLANNEKKSEQVQRTAWRALASLFTQLIEVPREFMPLCKLTLSTIIKESTSVTFDYYKEYLKLLYKMEKYEELFDEAINMHTIYETNIYPLEWISKVYVEMAIEENPIMHQFDDRIDKYTQKLFDLQTDAIMGIFMQGVKAFQDRDFMSARDSLKRVVDLRSGLVHAWTLLAESLLKLYCYNDATLAAIRADNILQTITRETLCKKHNKIFIAALCRHTNEDKWKLAIELVKKKDIDTQDEDILISLAMAHINLGNYVEAKSVISQLSNARTADLILLNAKLLSKQGNWKEALKLLIENNVQSCEAYIDIGTLYWNMEEYDKSLVPFLKAAKLDPNNFECFVFLGRYYENIKDIDKARRCYQKAYFINSQCSAAGQGLSHIYRQQKNWAANLDLLQSITGKDNFQKGSVLVINSQARWAWLQLGLHYLEQEDYFNAIDILRSVIRVEPDNSYYWECLADAYKARGSYTSALKSYEHAAELSVDNLYPKLQVASIKLLIGHFKEAIIGFDEVLSTNKRYVPALKGIAETYMHLALTYQKEQLLGLCRTNAQNALDNLTIALKEKGNLSCLWKLTGDSCALVATLPEKYCCMVVSAIFAEDKENDDYDILTRDQLFTLAARCYCKAIHLFPNNMFLWNDLATCYYNHGFLTEDQSRTVSLLELALTTAKYCVKNNSGCWYHWNLVGVICAHKEMKNYELAQHAFIKAVIIEHNSAMAWCNLGNLYHQLGDVELANKSYSKAQRCDPSFVHSWVGQALIAEKIGHEDAMDLFRHSTQLDFTSHGAMGYASWVCKMINEAPAGVNIYSIHNMHAVPVAWDAMSWYTEINPDDACGWNMLGILSERMGLKLTAMRAYKISYGLLPPQKRDKALIKYARALVNLKQYNKAIETYKVIKEPSFNGGCGLALALFKAEQYEDSYESYNTAMQWLTENENMQSHILVALAAMVYMFQGPDEAKNLLFQSTQLKPPSHWGLYATLSLGLLHEDLNLAVLVLKELEIMKDEPSVIHHYSILSSYIHFLKGDTKSCIRSLCKSVHRHPNQASLWLSLAIMNLQTKHTNSAQSASKCAQIAMYLGRSQMDVTKVWCIVAYASLASMDIHKALKSAQKAIHCYPDIAEGWAVLISTLNLCDYLQNKWVRKSHWLKSTIEFVNTHLSLTEDLKTWISTISVR